MTMTSGPRQPGVTGRNLRLARRGRPLKRCQSGRLTRNRKTGGSASGGSGTVQLVQELFPGRILSREPLNTTEDPAGMGVESEGYEYPEADETSPAGSGEDA